MGASLYLDGVCALAPVELVVLDKDGTLIDIHHYWSAMIKARARLLCARAAPTLRATGDAATPTPSLAEEAPAELNALYGALVDGMGLLPSHDRLKAEGPVGVKPREVVVARAREVLDQHGYRWSMEAVEAIFGQVDVETRGQLAPLLRLLPHTREFLQQARRLGVRLAIATTDLSARAGAALAALGLEDYFDLVVGADQVRQTKPAPEMGNTIAQTLAIDPARIAMIGDHRVDMEMGIACGFGCAIGVLTGLCAAADFSELPVRIVSSFGAIALQ